MPLFSIMIPTRNRANVLRYAIQSVLNQDFDDYELIVSDNDSSDDTYKTTREFNSRKIRYKYIYSHIGYNLEITDMQAAVGVEQLKKLPSFIEARKKNFKSLFEKLRKYEKYFILPQATVDSEASWFGFPITVKENAPFTRGKIVNYLEENKIATKMFFGNLIKQPDYENIKYRVFGSLRNTDLVMKKSFLDWRISGDNGREINYVVKIFDRFLGGLG